MKTRLTALVVTLLTSAVCVGADFKPNNWLSTPKTDLTENQKLAETSFAEVRITRLMAAVDDLKEQSAIPITEKMAKYYVGVSFKTEKGSTPYLVRGLFANYTGQFSLFWKDGDLLVQHDSLGKHFTPQFCPLVVNLPSEPKRVFVVVSGDE